MKPTLFEQLSSQVAESLKNSPLRNLEGPITQLVSKVVEDLGLVRLEDFDVQRQVLERLHQRVAHLEQKLQALELERTQNAHTQQNAPSQSLTKP